MPATPHVERHFTSGETVRDIVIGMSDGLTVPFALAAGLSGAVESTSIVITAGFAEIAAGSIAMGLGGYLAARSDAEHYASERRREQAEIGEIPAAETNEVLELGLEQPDPKRALVSAATIAGAYIAGGLIPLAPYFFVAAAARALTTSVAFTLLALFVFGYVRSFPEHRNSTAAGDLLGLFSQWCSAGASASAPPFSRTLKSRANLTGSPTPGQRLREEQSRKFFP
jgi:VIT1/CCC1 family predicted Fe2+/Mn2+ transporter